MGLLAAAVDIGIDADVYDALGGFYGETYSRKMNLSATYDASEGKFPAAYGNVALIDCHYLLSYIFDYAAQDIKPALPWYARHKFQDFLNDLEE